jgi:hypothetical protein
MDGEIVTSIVASIYSISCVLIIVPDLYTKFGGEIIMITYLFFVSLIIWSWTAFLCGREYQRRKK